MLQRKPVRIISTLLLLSVFLSAIPVGAVTTKDITITKLQTFLQSKGFLVIPKGDTKGSFGPATKQALIKYQKSVGLSAQGVFGMKTKAKIATELSGASRSAGVGTTTQESTQLATSSAALSPATTTSQTLANSDQLVTEASLNARLQAIYRQIALSQRIDQLNNTTITGGSISGTAISGLSTNTVGEGSNLYYTNSRTDARLSATSSLPNMTTLSGLTSIGTSGTATTFNGNVAINATLRAKEGPGMKLRRLMSQAASNNPWLKSPMIAAPNWQATTTYAVGNVVINGSQMYICSTGGTSAGSGGPSGTGNTAITDGAVTWYYYGVPPTPIGPAVTLSKTFSPVSGLTKRINVPDYASSFFFAGGPVTVSDTPGWTGFKQYTFPFQTVTPGNTANHWAAVTFMTDAPKFAIEHGSAVTFRLIIDGQFVTLNGLSGSGVRGYDVVDFSSVGGRKTRKVTVESGGGYGFNAVNVGPADSVWAPDPADNLRVMLVGTSITAGGGVFPAVLDEGWPHIVAKYLGWNDVWNDGSGGTGYIAATNGAYNYNQRVTDVTANAPDLIVVEGGINDSSYDAPTLTAAVQTYYRTIRTALPTVPIIVLGAYPAATGPSAAFLTTEATIQTAIAALNDSGIYWVPMSSDAAGAWVSGTGKITATTGTGNSDIYTSADGTHPTEAGLIYLAQRATAAIRKVIPQIP